MPVLGRKLSRQGEGGRLAALRRRPGCGRHRIEAAFHVGILFTLAAIYSIGGGRLPALSADPKVNGPHKALP